MNRIEMKDEMMKLVNGGLRPWYREVFIHKNCGLPIRKLSKYYICPKCKEIHETIYEFDFTRQPLTVVSSSAK